MENEEIKKLLKKNLELTEEIHGMVKSVKRYVIWQRVFSILKILIILVPIILGIIYLPPIAKRAYEQYKEIMGFSSNPIDISVENLKSILAPDILDKLKEDVNKELICWSQLS